MRRKSFTWFFYMTLLVYSNTIGSIICPMSEDQLKKSLDMMRNACAPKFKVTTDQLDNLRKGIFDGDKEMKCYTLCIYQMAGTLTRKNEISLDKVIKQIDAMMPVHKREPAIETFTKCKDVQKEFKDPCDKTYMSVKCVYDTLPEHFIFP